MFLLLANSLLASITWNRLLISGGRVLSNDDLHSKAMTAARIETPHNPLPLFIEEAVEK